MADNRRTDSIREYSQGWFDKMVEIWRDRLGVLRIKDTGALRGSVEKGHFSIGEAGGSLAFRSLNMASMWTWAWETATAEIGNVLVVCLLQLFRT